MAVSVKKWYKSKTIWINLIGIASVLLGVGVLTPEQTASALAVINLVLRAVTNESIGA